MITGNLFATITTIIRTTFICLGLGHQAYTNSQNKSAKAISSYTQLLTQTIIFCYIGYMFLLDQPLICIISGCIKFAPITFITFQKYSYESNPSNKKDMWHMLGIIFLFVLSSAFISYWFPQEVGHFFGWLMFAINVIRFTPQVIHNWKRKSVKGYSPLYMSAIVFAGFGHMIEAIFFNMPLQSYINAAYAISIRLILAYQYLRYAR